MKQFTIKDLVLPYFSFIQGATLGSTYATNFSFSFNEKLVMLTDKVSENLAALTTRNQTRLWVVIIITIILAFFKTFDPVIAVLGLIIFSLILAILRVHIGIHSLRKRQANEKRKSSEDFETESTGSTDSFYGRSEDFGSFQYDEYPKKY